MSTKTPKKENDKKVQENDSETIGKKEKCSHCLKEFYTRKDLRTHLENRSKQNCKKCDFESCTIFGLMKHQDDSKKFNFTGKLKLCDIGNCNFKECTSQGLTDHVKNFNHDKRENIQKNSKTPKKSTEVEDFDNVPEFQSPQRSAEESYQPTFVPGKGIEYVK